jgi:mono/diheme cytochrome c family protein
MKSRVLRQSWMVITLGFSSMFASACRRDMQDQPKYTPLEASSFFVDGRSARPLPPNTIARGHLNDNDPFHTGADNGAFLNTIPMDITKPLLERGQQRYNIYCSPCHGELGYGDGMIARRGFKVPANFHNDRLRQAPPGYMFQVISNGYGAMPDYSNQIPHAEDRWAIVAYVRALQLSRNATAADVPPEEKPKLGLQ